MKLFSNPETSPKVIERKLTETHSTTMRHVSQTIRSEVRRDQDGRVGRCGTHPLTPKYIKNTCTCGIMFMENQLETGRRTPIQPKPRERSPCNHVGPKKEKEKERQKALGQDLCPWGVWVRSTLGSEQVESCTAHPSPGVLHGGGKLPCLLEVNDTDRGSREA